MKFLRFLLFPFAIIYDVVTTIRNFFFNVGVFKQTTFNTPVIVVGNLSVGGTGKTPQIEYLIRQLNKRFKVAVLSRGYKRKTNGFVLLNDVHKAIDVGDEPLQYFKKFKDIDVAVDANRVEGVKKLLQQKTPEVILLDDAYQHRKIKGSFYILLTKFDDLFTNDFLLPTGNLRESRAGAKRADIIIVTKCPSNLNKSKQIQVKNKLKKFEKEVFFTSISYGNILSKETKIELSTLINYDILLVTGIANPNPLLDFLSTKKLNYKHLKYADHHNFTSAEIESIKLKFDELESDKKIILTTEKDFTRLYDIIDNLFYIEIEVCFLENQRIDFNDKIISHIQQNRC